MPDIAENLAAVKEHIRELSLRSGRRNDAVELIAVSKTRTLEEVRQAAAAGQRHFGENTMQDALGKIPALVPEQLDWHFIGHLQSKKSNQVPGHFHWVHSIDSDRLAQKLSTAMLNKGVKTSLNCLIQLNLSAETGKSGLSSAELKPFIENILNQGLPCLDWRGLMTIGVQHEYTETRKVFSSLRELRDECQREFGLKKFDQLSMGMSNDYDIAIEEGATLVRIGTAIFGPRQV